MTYNDYRRELTNNAKGDQFYRLVDSMVKPLIKNIGTKNGLLKDIARGVLEGKTNTEIVAVVKSAGVMTQIAGMRK